MLNSCFSISLDHAVKGGTFVKILGGMGGPCVAALLTNKFQFILGKEVPKNGVALENFFAAQVGIGILDDGHGMLDGEVVGKERPFSFSVMWVEVSGVIGEAIVTVDLALYERSVVHSGE